MSYNAFLEPTLYAAGPVGRSSTAGEAQSQSSDHGALATAIIAHQEVDVGAKLDEQIGVAHEVGETHGNNFATTIKSSWNGQLRLGKIWVILARNTWV